MGLRLSCSIRCFNVQDTCARAHAYYEGWKARAPAMPYFCSCAYFLHSCALFMLQCTLNKPSPPLTSRLQSRTTKDFDFTIWKLTIACLRTKMAQKCVHKGCGKDFSDPDEPCNYHPGTSNQMFHSIEQELILLLMPSRVPRRTKRSVSLTNIQHNAPRI